MSLSAPEIARFAARLRAQEVVKAMGMANTPAGDKLIEQAQKFEPEPSDVAAVNSVLSWIKAAGFELAPRQAEEPIDPDVLAVRAILHAHQRAMTPPDSGWGNMSYLEGSYDDLPCFQAALAAFKDINK
jgi:hypothetical protein